MVVDVFLDACEIPHRLERGMKHSFYKGVDTSPYQTCFRNLKGKPKKDNIR